LQLGREVDAGGGSIYRDTLAGAPLPSCQRGPSSLSKRRVSRYNVSIRIRRRSCNDGCVSGPTPGEAPLGLATVRDRRVCRSGCCRCDGGSWPVPERNDQRVLRLIYTPGAHAPRNVSLFCGAAVSRTDYAANSSDPPYIEKQHHGVFPEARACLPFVARRSPPVRASC
jgi:hypothetical protein